MRDGAHMDLNARYFDALTLLVGEAGRLVSKDRFMEEVWRGVPVTDEALTQCIKTLRRILGDDASSPRFIETVPKYGYRFIASAANIDVAFASSDVSRPFSWLNFLLLGGAAAIGGGIAGLIGGIIYGLVGASQPFSPGMGTMSVLLVLTSLCVVVGMAGGAGVGLGIAASLFAVQRRWWLSALGGGLGGLAVGAIAKLLGMDAFNLLLGISLGNITGAGEGALLGAMVGCGLWISVRMLPSASLWRRVLPPTLAGGLAGLSIALVGGRLMGGSLDLLARQFPESRLRLDGIGGWFGENGFGAVSQIVSCAGEGMLFGACVAAAMLIARRHLDDLARR